MDEVSSAWLTALSSDGAEQDLAHRRLYDVLSKVALKECYRRAASTRIDGPELDDIAQQAADDAMVSLLAKLDTFRGEVGSRLGRTASLCLKSRTNYPVIFGATQLTPSTPQTGIICQPSSETAHRCRRNTTSSSRQFATQSRHSPSSSVISSSQSSSMECRSMRWQ